MNKIFQPKYIMLMIILTMIFILGMFKIINEYIISGLFALTISYLFGRSLFPKNKAKVDFRMKLKSDDDG